MLGRFISSNRFTNTLSLAAAILLLTATIIIMTVPPAKGYEMSVYDAIPWFAWFTLITSIILGQIILIVNAINPRKKSSPPLGLIIIILANSILLFMPMIRGYEIYGREDVLSHIGWVREILDYGNIGSTNVYPINHILASCSVMISGIGIDTLSMAIPAIFSIFYIFSFIVLVRQMGIGKENQLLILGFASILIFGNLQLSFAPQSQAFMLLPLSIYLCIRSRQTQWNLSFIILSIVWIFLLVFYHPLNLLLFILILGIISITSRLRSPKIDMMNDEFVKHRMTLLMAIALVSFFIWQSWSIVLLGNLRRVLLWFIGQGGISEFQDYSKSINAGDFSLIDLLIKIINIMGPWIIVGIATLICSIYLIRLSRNTNRRIMFWHQLSIVAFLILGFLSIITFITSYVVGFGRIFVIAIIFSTILIPASYHHWLLHGEKSVRKFIKTMIICIFIISLILLSTLNLYLSPRVNANNLQVSDQEVIGMDYFFNIRNENFSILELEISQSRFYDLIFTHDAARKNIIYGQEARPQDHFGYVNATEFGPLLNDQKYLIINNLARNIFAYTYPTEPERWLFTPNDFNRLSEDPSIQLIYANGDLDVYLTYPFK